MSSPNPKLSRNDDFVSTGGGVESVTGLNTDNTDPLNPIVKISVDGTTITGTGTPLDPLVAIGGGGGSVNSVTGNIVDNTDPVNPVVTQVQADWSQASSGAVDFIKNKPTIPTQYTDEEAQDAVGNIFVDTDTVSLKYNDTTPSISADALLQMSIVSDSGGIKLDGDASAPGTSQYYGTDGSGTKGFYSLPAGTGDMILAATQTNTGAKTFNFSTLLDKGSEVFNVKAYGAVGNGVTDDTTAITAAYTDAVSKGGGIIFFPKGEYIISDSLPLTTVK